MNKIEESSGKTKIKINNPENNIASCFIFQSQTKNYCYYHCVNRPLYKGRDKLNKNSNLFQITSL